MKPLLARLALSVCVLAAAWLGGCATQPEDASLDMRLVNLRFAQATVLETTVVADIRFENVAPADVEITGAAHKIVVNGRRLGRGLASNSITIPRLGSAIQSVEVRLGHLSVAKTLDEVSRSHLVDYEIDSTLYFRAAGGRERSTKLQRKGILDLSRMAIPGGR
jgi:LEA14-like dessication related protein